ncbi:MAG: single-stranded DNA-binding protein [Planctomycetes bacterium]|nr:single-stranded DNA-binding protein [Planctomycetota bacterium]
MNHCVLEVDVLQAPTLRYTQDNQTPIAEMDVSFDALRQDDPKGQLKVVGWGNLAQDLQNRVQVGQRLVIEGRLRMNTVPRQDGTKEKRAEFTLSRLHSVGAPGSSQGQAPAAAARTAPARPVPAQTAHPSEAPAKPAAAGQDSAAQWNTSPLVPETDDIPF